MSKDEKYIFYSFILSIFISFKNQTMGEMIKPNLVYHLNHFYHSLKPIDFPDLIYLIDTIYYHKPINFPLFLHLNLITLLCVHYAIYTRLLFYSFKSRL